MGQKIHPYGFRLGVTTDWKSKWFATGEQYAEFLHEDDQIRSYIRERDRHAGISRIEITRSDDRVEIGVYAARPGIVIGRGGSEADAIRDALEEMTGRNIKLNILEVKSPELDAQVLAFNTAEQIRGRVSFRRAMRRAVQSATKAGAEGVKVQLSGRLGGREMSRTEWQREGQVPLHTLRALVDYGFDEARTTYGRIGVKLWVYKGDVLLSAEEAEGQRALRRAQAAAEGRPSEQPPGRRQTARKAARAAARAAGLGRDGKDEEAESPRKAPASPPREGEAEEVAKQTPAVPTPEQQPVAEPADQGTARGAGAPAGDTGPASVTESGETAARTTAGQATTEQAPSQSGAMDVGEVAPDAEEAPATMEREQSPPTAEETDTDTDREDG